MASAQSAEPAPGSYEYFKNELARDCRSTEESWSLLRKIFDRDYNKISRIWREIKSANIRARILPKAIKCDEATDGYVLAKARRPDLNKFIASQGPSQGPSQGHDNTQPDVKPMYAFLFPHLTEEDLVYGDIVPRFIHNRATHHWTEYCHNDLYSCRAGQSFPDFHALSYRNEKGGRTLLKEPPPEMDLKLIHFKARQPDDIQGADFADYCEEYDASAGSLGFSQGLEGSRTKLIAKGREALDKFSYPQALQIAKIQLGVYSYLVDLCLDILLVPVQKHLQAASNDLAEEEKLMMLEEEKFRLRRGLEEYELQNNSYDRPDVREVEKQNKADADALPELTEMRLHAYYGAPDAFEWAELQQLIDSKVDSARAALLDLRSDPDIFEASIRRARWNRSPDYDPTVELDLDPKDGEFTGVSKLKSWQDAMKFCISKAIQDFDRWCELQDAFNHFRAVYERHRVTLETKDKSDKFWDAAKELDTAMYGFHSRAHSISEKVVMELQKVLLVTPYFSKIFHVAKAGHGNSSQVNISIDQAVKTAGPEKRVNVLWKLARLLLSDRLKFGLSALLDDLERERNKRPEPDQTKTGNDPGNNDDTVSGQTSHEQESSVYNTSAPNAAQQVSVPEQTTQEELPGQEAEEEGPEGSNAAKKNKNKKKKKKNKKKKKKQDPAEEDQEPEYLTEEVLRIVSDLSVFAECLSQVEHFQPWVTLYFADWNNDPRKEEVKESLKELQQHFLKLIVNDNGWRAAFESGLPKKHRFYYPISERRTEHVVMLLELAEENLDRFWSDLLKEQTRDKQDGLSARTRTLLEETPKRTQWTVQEPKGKGKEKELADAQHQAPTDEIMDEQQEEGAPTDDVEMPDAPEPPAAPKTPSPPKKTPTPPQKTTPKRRREEEEEPKEQSPPKVRKVAKPAGKGKQKQKEPAATDESRKILLPRKVYPDLHFLFNVPGTTDSRKSLKWTAVTTLLTKMGFSGRSRSGSMWRFEPVTDALVSKIPETKRGGMEIHSPHPETTLHKGQLRRYGQTMQNNYGLTLDMFGSL